MPADNKPRWITVREKADYRWPDRSAISAFQPGEHYVKAEVADDLVGRGKASEGRADGSEARAPKGNRARRRKAKATNPPKPATPAGDAAPDTGTNARVGGENLAADDSAGAGEPVAPAAE